MRTNEVKKWTDLEWILIELLNKFIIQIPDQLLFNPDNHIKDVSDVQSRAFYFYSYLGQAWGFSIFAKLK